MTIDPRSKDHVIIGAQLKKARELLQFSPAEVAHEINVNMQDIIDWEEARIIPGLKQLEELAEIYGREIDYFLRATPAPPEKIEFRGKPGQSIKNLSKETKIVLAKFDELCRNALEFEHLLNKKIEVKLPRFEKSYTPEMGAQNLRTKFRIGDKPLIDLRNHLEDEGVRIFELPVPEDTFSGFSFWHLEYGPCILINANELTERKNFTLAHELAHLLYSHGSSLCYTPLKLSEVHKGIEYEASQFALELLLPAPSLKEDFKNRGLSKEPSKEQLAKMAYNKWGVSIQAMGYRLENLGLIKQGYTDTLFELKRQFRGGRSRISKWEKQLGKRYVSTSFEAYRKGLISIGKLAHGLGITIRQALEEIEKRGNPKA